MAEDYEVGYGKPPKKHQWKQGQSGNPSGKKGRTNKAAYVKPFSDYIVDELLKPINVKIGGKSQTIPTVQALAKRLLHDVLHANPKEMILLLKQIAAMGAFDGLENLVIKAKEEAEYEPLINPDEKLMLEAIYRALGIEEDDT